MQSEQLSKVKLDTSDVEKHRDDVSRVFNMRLSKLLQSKYVSLTQSTRVSVSVVYEAVSTYQSTVHAT